MKEIRKQAISFYLLTLVLSWGYWVTLLWHGVKVDSSSVAHFPGLLGPMLAAIVVTSLFGGRDAIRELFKRMFWLGPNWVYKLLLALSPLGIGAIAFILIDTLGKPFPPLAAFANLPGLLLNWPMTLLAVLIVNGLGEETGWRGFLTEHLLLKYHRFHATLIVAVLWAFWHLPLVWLNSGMAAMVGPMMFGWFFALVCGAFVLTMVYLATGHSILCVALWHVTFNMMVTGPVGTGLLAAFVSIVVMMWGSIIAVLWRRKPTAI
jgi:uncharacterized protein